MKTISELRWRWCPWHESPCTICASCKGKSCCSRGCPDCRDDFKLTEKVVRFALDKCVAELYGADAAGTPDYGKFKGVVSYIAVRARLAEKFGLHPDGIWGREVKKW